MKTNHEKMKEFIEGRKFTGKGTRMRFIPLPNDEVSVTCISSKLDSSLELPDFVTGIGDPNFENSAFGIFSVTECYFEKIHLKGIKIYGNSIGGWLKGAPSVREVILEDIDFGEVSDMMNMFSELTYLKSVKFINCDTSHITDMSEMFCDSNMLEEVDIRCFDTRNVVGTYDMFASCKGLKSLDLSHFDTSKVTDMESMFHSCINLRELDLRSFDTREVKTMSHMFSNCIRLEKLDISSFQINSGVNVTGMFLDCMSIKDIKVRESYRDILMSTNEMSDYDPNFSEYLKNYNPRVNVVMP